MLYTNQGNYIYDPAMITESEWIAGYVQWCSCSSTQPPPVDMSFEKLRVLWVTKGGSHIVGNEHCHIWDSRKYLGCHCPDFIVGHFA